MMGRSHLLFAGAAYAALASRPIETPLGALPAPVLRGAGLADGPAAFILSLAVAAACGLAPDIDKAGSTAARSLGFATRVLAWGIERGFGHRKGFHSLVGMALGFLLGELLGVALGLANLGALVLFGWTAHLLTDVITVRGVPLFWPLRTAPVRLPPRIVTGTWEEAVVLAVVMVGLLFYVTGGQVPRPWDASPSIDKSTGLWNIDAAEQAGGRPELALLEGRSDLSTVGNAASGGRVPGWDR